MKNLVLISQVGISMITPILLGLFIGNKLDKWLGWNGIMTIILILMGVAAGFLNTYKLLDNANNQRKRVDKNESD